MRRRDLFALGTLAVAATAAGSASAGGPTSSSGTVAPSLNIAGVGVPIIAGGRIRNYVFVTLRLTLGSGQTPEMMRAKEPYYRDALVRQAHRTPFVLADDWTRVDSEAISAWLMRAAPSISGAGSIASAEVALQTPRRRTGVRPV
ncbi:hypothetical protein IP78_11060 [Brevundimonas sp. AAP58]|uniref:hypothetical protein n=1 Tax=Brevundimonas sp. AAP58 TaxID=1523422 RepID=UPI0006B88960|nr:hypothetical protein [Brevundimonas sp. AAP58]KPF78518.1 hypothetical protein IP78_11060 [Brevundimonas sp. AAP58]